MILKEFSVFPYRTIPRGYIFWYIPWGKYRKFCVLENTLVFKEDNIEKSNFQFTTLRNDILVNLLEHLLFCFIKRFWSNTYVKALRNILWQIFGVLCLSCLSYLFWQANWNQLISLFIWKPQIPHLIAILNNMWH